MAIYRKFIEKTLNEEDIKGWLKEQGQIKFLIERQALTEKDLDHIAMCMHHIYLVYHGMRPRIALGDFLRALIQNDFNLACGRADDVNRLVLPLYAMFLYSCVPCDYRKVLTRRG